MEDIKSTFDLLKNGEKEIKLTDKYKDIVLVLGNTGAGKSTFTQWIAGDNDKLIAKEVTEGTGEFIIEDNNNRIGNSTIKSKTIYPELVIDTKTNTAYYDCPGFSDTRSTSNDIATTYFIKKVLDHAESVKLIFIINHSSVRKGVDRQDFMKLIRHATELVRKIEKFQNSIAIVVTKVDNQYVRKGVSFTLVEDTKVIGAIADFLQEVEKDLVERAYLPGISVKEQKFRDNARKFIEVLLVKEADTYTRMGIFRRPDQPGPLSNITILQEGKQHIETIINDKLKFTGKIDEDFGYTISDKSKSDINDIVEEINNDISSKLIGVAVEIKEYYRDLVVQVRDKVKSFVSSAIIVDADPSEAQAFSSKLNNNITSYLKEDLQNITNLEELARAINNSTISLDVKISEDNILDITNQGKYLEFLQIVSGKTLSTRPWAELFQDKLPNFSELRASLDNDISVVAQTINNRLNDTVKVIHEHYSKKMKFLEIEKLPSVLKEEQNVIFKLAKVFENAVAPNEIMKAMQTIYDVANNLGISITKKNIPIIANRQRYLNFLQIVGNEDLTAGSLTWICPFKNAVKYLDDSVNWYKFLNSLYSKFSEYDMQSNRSIYNVSNLKDWGKSGKPQGIYVNKHNFGEFLNKTAEYNIAEHNNIKNIKITDQQLEELNDVLNLTLKHRMNISCIKPYIFIKGNYISIKNIRDNIKCNIDMDDSCKDISTVIKSGKFKFINVFALNTVFIDDDVSLEGSLLITVIAPKWEVVGTRKIALNGVKGDRIQGGSRAKDGVYLGSKGTDGKPGLAGGPGGTFFGVGDQFVDGAKLEINVNGGVGGTGQNGGNGARGKFEQNATLPSGSNGFCECENHERVTGFHCKKLYSGNGGCIGCIRVDYKILGIPGGKGGNGGNGGKGGKGGLPGSIELFELDNYSGIRRVKDTGATGENGKGGLGGVRGGNEHYQDILAWCKSEWWFGTWYDTWHFKETITNKKPEGNNGMRGIDGANTYNMEDPKPGSGISELEKSKIINQYKSYLRENLNDKLKKFSLMQFLNKLNSNGNVKNLYNTLGLIDELRGLEEQFYKLKRDVDMFPFYQFLLDRIEEYAKNPKEIEQSNQYKMVRSFLYTATLGRIYNLQDNIESNLIIDITSYLDSLQEDNEKLKDLKNAKNKVDVINKYKQNYKCEIDIKIKEATDLISKEITPEIDNIGTEIDNKINSLIDEVILLQEQTKEEQKELLEKKQQLENSLALQSLFAPFKILGQVVSFLGPVGEVAGLAIGAGSEVAESFDLNGHSNVLKLPISASDLEALQGRIQTFGEQKVIRFKKILEGISQGIDDHPEKLRNIVVKIASLKDRLNKIDKNKFNFMDIQALEKELKLSLETQEEEIRNSFEVITDEDSKNALTVLNNCMKAVQLTTVMFDTYNKYKNNQTKLDAINNAIASAENKFKELKEYEDKIYNTIAPILQNIQNDLEDISSKLGTKSRVALDVIKWQVQSTLGDIELQMQQLTRSFEVKDNLIHYIKKLKDGMTTLINVYNHIQDYQEHQKFANYITSISSIPADDIISSKVGEELGTALRNLEITVRSSIILQRHQVAIDAFKQFVFPFAHIYLKGLVYLESGANRNDTSLENLIYKASTQIQHIKSKLRQYKVSMAEHDGPIGIGEFSSHYESTQPFFVWKNEQHKDKISKLLSGEEVVLKADMMNSSADEDAIKFNTIELNFNSKNVTTQSVVNNILKVFNISTTHMGDSYYRYNEKIYPMTTSSQVIWYYFERKANGEPVRRSIAYDKLKKGDFMLSPYALWKIKLINLRNKNNISFKDLEVFKNQIDLELGGNGYYVNKGGVTEDLMVERYYKEIDVRNLQVLNAKTEELNNVFLLQARNSIRKKREVNKELKYEESQTTVDENYPVTRNCQESTENGNNIRKPTGWFSWLKLPTFKLLPGAEAVVIERKNLKNEKQYKDMNLDDVSNSLINGITLLKDVLKSLISKSTINATNNYASEQAISNNYMDYIAKNDNTDLSINPKIDFDGSTNNLQAVGTVDINGNLILGHLVLHKVFGDRESLRSIDYLSPEQEQNIRINKLASEILLNGNRVLLPNHIIHGSDCDYFSAPQWCQDMFRDKIEEMTKKGN